MVTRGVDAHKRTHTGVATDENGRQLAERTVVATPAGHLEALRWAERWAERNWAIEDCRHLSRRLSADLLAAGERVVRVPPRLMGRARSSARTPGKSDPIDALAVARAALREPNLPAAQLDGPSRELRLLVDHREDLVAERTRIQNRLRWHLHEIQPGDEPPSRALDRCVVLDQLAASLEPLPGVVARVARELVDRCRLLTSIINDLEQEIAKRAAAAAPRLLGLPGCGPLTTAKIIGEAAGIRRFRSRHAFAAHNGTAPIPVWSGNHERFRLNRGGNRQLNCAIHRIAVTQMRLEGPGRDYLIKRRAAGNTKMEAIRALRRRISDEVYRRLTSDEAANISSAALPAAA